MRKDRPGPLVRKGQGRGVPAAARGGGPESSVAISTRASGTGPWRALALAAAAGLGALAATPLSATTLEDVQARGTVRCGVPWRGSDPIPTDAGGWTGFDLAICRALAAAVQGDASAFEAVPVMRGDGLRPLIDGAVDLVVRDGAWTLSRDADLPVDYAAVLYYDGQGFLVPKSAAIASAKELDGGKVCAVSDMRAVQNLDEFARVNNLKLAVVPEPDLAASTEAYLSGACEILSAQRSELAALRATFEAPTDHAILPDIISKEPLGPVVREGDGQWADIVRWTVFALVAAEELGVTSANVEEMAKAPASNAEMNRLLGTDGTLGAMLGLPDDWAKMAIKAGGNYGEIFARTLGEATPVGLPRGLNALWRDGGLLYPPPFR